MRTRDKNSNRHKTMITEEKFQKICEQSKSTWGSQYLILEKIIKLKDFKIGAEIGVAFGGNAENLLQNTNIIKLYGIDSYAPYKNSDINAIDFNQEDFDDIYKFTSQRLSKFNERFEFIRRPSTEAVGHVPNNLDFVYIDAGHSYQDVWSDLCVWFKKVKDGGIIAGDDYGHSDLPDVKKAVDEFFRRFDWKVNFENQVWWVEKKPLQVSFFIPTYNYGKSIRDSVESIMRNNFSNGDELIIFNDGSTDDTAKHLLELKSEYPEIKILSHAKNRGPSATRNDAVENCSNPIIFSHDHDNILVPGSIQKLKDFLINSGADVVAFGEMHFFAGKTDNVTHKWVFKNGPYTLADCLSDHHFPGASGNYMFTKESWLRAGGYPDSWMDSWGLGVRQIVTGSKMLTLLKTFYLHQYQHSHEYESTYIKGERTGKISSLTILQILMPFLFLLDKKSVNYMLSEWGRSHWFKRMKERPIRVRFNTIEEYEKHEEFVHQNPVIPSIISKIIKPAFEIMTEVKEVIKKIPLIKKMGIKTKKVFKKIIGH